MEIHSNIAVANAGLIQRFSSLKQVNLFSVFSRLKQMARAENCDTLVIESDIINERLGAIRGRGWTVIRAGGIQEAAISPELRNALIERWNLTNKGYERDVFIIQRRR